MGSAGEWTVLVDTIAQVARLGCPGEEDIRGTRTEGCCWAYNTGLQRKQFLGAAVICNLS